MDSKKKFILVNSESFNIDTQVNPDDTLENIINSLYNFLHSPSNLLINILYNIYKEGII